MVQLFVPAIAVAAIFTIVIGLIWLFFNYGLDQIKHPEEWKNSGSSGERIVYNTLVKRFKVPEKQILRNVYIPTANGQTSEIDLLVISKKGLLVFECKNYAGNIYGDVQRKQWIQYLGRQKYYFYNPFMQNRTHVRNLKSFLNSYGELPIISLVTTTQRGKWHVRNLGSDDHLLGYNSCLEDILGDLPISENIVKHFGAILAALTPLSRPDQAVVEKHIVQTYHRKSRT